MALTTGDDDRQRVLPTAGSAIAVAFLLVAVGLAVIAAWGGHHRDEWGFVGFAGALVPAKLAVPPRFRVLRPYRRALEFISAVMALGSSAAFLSADRGRVTDVMIGVCAALLGVMALLPALAPELHMRHPVLFGRPG